MQVRTLIDKAATVCNGKSQLAAVLGVSPQRVNDWHKSHRPCPIERQVQLCDLAGLPDAVVLDHVRQLAGVLPKKNGGWASLPMVLCAFVVSAAAHIEPSRIAAMYIMSTQRIPWATCRLRAATSPWVQGEALPWRDISMAALNTSTWKPSVRSISIASCESSACFWLLPM